MAPSCTVLHIEPGKPLAKSLQSEATAQGSADHSISSVLLIRKHRKQHFGDFLHRCAGINAPQLNYRFGRRMQSWAFHVLFAASSNQDVNGMRALWRDH